MAQAIVFKASGKINHVELITDKDLKASIGGGWLEGLIVKNDKNVADAMIFCDEDGKSKELPRNNNATTMFQKHYIIGMRYHDYFAGDIVVVGLLDEHGKQDGETHDVPQWLVDKIKKHFTIE